MTNRADKHESVTNHQSRMTVARSMHARSTRPPVTRAHLQNTPRVMLPKAPTHLLPLVVHRDRELVVQQRPITTRPIAGGHLPAGVHGPAAFQEKAPVGWVARHDVGWNLSSSDAVGRDFYGARKSRMGTRLATSKTEGGEGGGGAGCNLSLLFQPSLSFSSTFSSAAENRTAVTHTWHAPVKA